LICANGSGEWNWTMSSLGGESDLDCQGLQGLKSEVDVVEGDGGVKIPLGG
jgi:hypothetical protein